MKNVGILFTVLAALAALVIVATGCDGDKKDSNPRGSSMVPYPVASGDSPLPYGDEMQPNPQVALDRSKNSGSRGGEWSTWKSVIFFLVALPFLIFGGVLCRGHNWRWGLPFVGGGLVATAFLFDWYFGPSAWWVALLIWMGVWAISLATRFRWDDRIVYGGSGLLLFLTLLGRAIPAFGPGPLIEGTPTLTWGAAQFLAVIAIAPGVWDEPALGNRPWLKYLVLLPMWVALLFLH